MIIVTGASGFLGSAIVDQCRSRALDVRAVAFRGRRVVPGAVTLDPSGLAAAFEGSRAVIHAAGLAHGGGKFSAAEYRSSNVELTRAVAQAACDAGVPRFVLVSSVSVYGGGRQESVDETRVPIPEGPYASSKLEAEHAAREVATRNGMQLFVLRPATIVGEGDPGNVARLIAAIVNRRFLWVGTGENRKSLIHRSDVARACVLAATNLRARPDSYNVAGDSPRMRDIVALVSTRAGRSPIHLAIPDVWLRNTGRILSRLPAAPGRAGSVLRKWATNDVYDGSRFRKETAFEPEVSWKEALEREVDWFLSQAR